MKPDSTNSKLLHVPCKFYRQGVCQAGSQCPFSHNLQGVLAADKLPCKYFQKGNCKFGLKCALAHFLPDGTRINPQRTRRGPLAHRANPGNAVVYPANSGLLVSPISAVVYPSAVTAGGYLILMPPENAPLAISPEVIGYDTSPRWGLEPAPILFTTTNNPQQTLAILDDEDNKTLLDFEDYIPGLLSDLILTPQEKKRRVLRSQLGTLGDHHREDLFIMD